MSEYLIGAGVVLSLPYVLGFGAAGVVGGSAAAAIQSCIGNVALGSAFSLLQSLGATGVVANSAVIGSAISGTGIL